MKEMRHTEKTLEALLADKTAENLAVRLGRGNDILYEAYLSRDGIDARTLFDMASVTKVMATTLLSLIALDEGRITTEDTLGRFYACGEDKRNITLGNLLTHTFGIGHQPLNRAGITYENVAEAILALPLETAPGGEVLYSCPAFILLGKILEKVYGDRLDHLFARKIAARLPLPDTGFLPDRGRPIVNANLTEGERGIVNDYNARFLGGVAGNAGLFSDMEDVTAFAKLLIGRGAGLVGEATFARAVQNHTPHAAEARGLGFLWVDERYPQTGGLFPPGSVGHCGHTGQSCFVDPASGLYAIILSDATICSVKKHGAEVYADTMEMRRRIHAAMKEDLAP